MIRMLLPERSRRPEIMDSGRFTRAELEGNLSDLRFYNRVTGGIAAIAGDLRDMISSRPAGSTISILDVGAGGGDVARALAAWISRRGYQPMVVASDLNERFLRYARREGESPAGSEIPDRLPVCVADAVALPFGDGGFDLACSCLVMHHLDEETIGRTLAEMRRVTRLGFVALDLRRSMLSLGLIWTLTRITTRNRLTLHDGPLSVRRALTVREFRRLAQRALGGGTESRATGSGGKLLVRRQGGARLLINYKHSRQEAGH
jgi:SAM-dependent methyltransferase